MNTKHCKAPDCQESNPQPLENFWNNKGQPDGKYNFCKVCARKRQRQYTTTPERKARRRQTYRENPQIAQKSWERGLKHKYGITPEEYAQQLDAQDNKCAICKEVKQKRLVVDHNHDTGQVRGLLCSHCNSVLGFARENREIIIGVAQYMIEFDIS